MAYPKYRKYSAGHEERKRMKGSSYKTGLGKARSGRKWAQRLREGQSLQVRCGEDERRGHKGCRFQPPAEEAGRKGRNIPLGLRRRPSGDGWGLETLRPGLSRQRNFNCKHVKKRYSYCCGKNLNFQRGGEKKTVTAYLGNEAK